MPWQVQPDTDGKGFFVVNTKTGKKYSKNPLTKEKADAQLRIMYSRYAKKPDKK
jgi:hypothetical protein